MTPEGKMKERPNNVKRGNGFHAARGRGDDEREKGMLINICTTKKKDRHGRDVLGEKASRLERLWNLKAVAERSLRGEEGG